MRPLSDFLPACRQRYKQFRPNEFPEYVDCKLPPEFIRLCPWEATYIYNVARMAKVGIVEIGRFYGGSTLLLAAACNKDIKIHSLDIDPQDDEKLVSYARDLELTNINLYLHDSTDIEASKYIEYDVVFIDGDHTYNGVYKDMEAWYPRLKKGGHMIFHDSYMMYEIPNAIIDFTINKNVQFFLSPINPEKSWQIDTGSICHFRKLED